jgi:hypothetical protein
MNYSGNPAMVRVDYFKPISGKWYMTEAVDMGAHYDDASIHDAVRYSIMESRDGRGGGLLTQFIAVVAEPYHRLAYPIMLMPR